MATAMSLLLLLVPPRIAPPAGSAGRANRRGPQAHLRSRVGCSSSLAIMGTREIHTPTGKSLQLIRKTIDSGGWHGPSSQQTHSHCCHWIRGVLLLLLLLPLLLLPLQCTQRQSHSPLSPCKNAKAFIGGSTIVEPDFAPESHLALDHQLWYPGSGAPRASYFRSKCTQRPSHVSLSPCTNVHISIRNVYF